MIVQAPFYGLDKGQIDIPWVQCGCGLEANVFDNRDFDLPNGWTMFESSLSYAHSLEPSLLTVHFPTENADFLTNPQAHDNLMRAIQLAHKYSAAGITIHANQFVCTTEWGNFDVIDRRQRFLEYLRELDDMLHESKVWVSVENLPIIGNQGNDFDSVFVYPSDFNEFDNFSNIYITWDLCHWAITYLTHKAFSHMFKKNEFQIDFDAYHALSRIKHFHFGSFKQLAVPFSSAVCYEGVHPEEGDIDPNLLLSTLRYINQNLDANTGLVLEVHEQDYYHRTTTWKTLQWIQKGVSEVVNNGVFR